MDSTTLAPLYTPLNPAKSELRMIKVPFNANKGLQLEKVSLDDKPTFLALSYVWGDSEIRENITLNGQNVSVTTNLKEALDFIRHIWAGPQSREGHRYFWADAVCINQRGIEERSYQVQLMRRIFSSASVVLSWVGPNDHSLAFQAIKIIAEEVKSGAESRPPEDRNVFQLDSLKRHPLLYKTESEAQPGNNFLSPAWSAIAKFLEDPYWTRVWIFQEVVLARNLRIIGPGGSWLKWEDLVTASVGLRLLRARISEQALERPRSLSTDVWRAISTPMVEWTEITLRATARDQMMRQNRDPTGAKSGWRLNLFAALLHARDPKDYIYGLLGVTQLSVVPDYRPTTSLADVYTDYVVGWLEEYRARRDHEFGSLTLLALGGIGHFGHDESFPTWAPNYPSVGMLVTRLATGSADRDVFGDDSDKYPYVEKSSKSLFVWGLEIDSISLKTWVPTRQIEPDGQLLTYVLDFQRRHPQYISGISPIQAFSQVMHRDHSTTVSKATVVRDLSFLAFLARPSPRVTPEKRDEVLRCLGFSLQPAEFDRQFWSRFFPGVNSAQLGFDQSPRKTLTDWPRGPIGDAWMRMWHSFLNLDRNWQFIETGTGYLGLAPLGTSLGDLLCVLKGIGIPMVLRKAAEGHYVVVGTAWVAGLMNGEAATLQSVPREFELR